MTSPKPRTWARACGVLLAVAGVAGAAHLASGHPHSWASVRAVMLVADGKITGFQQAWTFDEGFSMTALDGLDTNNDGIYAPSELEPLAKFNIDGMKDYNYFTTVSVGERALAFGTPTEYRFDYADNVLTFHFTLPLAEPLPAKDVNATFGVGDPSYYIGFGYAEQDALTIKGAEPLTCTAKRPVLELPPEPQSLSSASETAAVADPAATAAGSNGAAAVSGSSGAAAPVASGAAAPVASGAAAPVASGAAAPVATPEVILGDTFDIACAA